MHLRFALRLLAVASVTAGAASLTACSALTEPDAITISAEPVAKATAPLTAAQLVQAQGVQPRAPAAQSPGG